MFNLLKRVNRKTYFLGLLLCCVRIGLLVLLVLTLPLGENGNFEPQYDIPLLIILLCILWFNVCITRQRANDISGKHPLVWLFFSFFLIGPIIGLIPGEKTANKFGPVPADFNLFEK